MRAFRTTATTHQLSPGGFVLVVVAGIAMIALFVWTRRQQTRAGVTRSATFGARVTPGQLPAVAAANGWSYARKGSHHLATERNLHASAFMVGGVTNVVTGTAGGWQFTAFDLRGRQSSECCVVVHLPVPATLPHLAVLTRADMLLNAGPEVVHFESDDFRAHFTVVCDNGRFAYDFVSPLGMQRMLASPQVSYDITGRDLSLFTHSELTAGALTYLVRLAVDVLHAVPDFVWHNVGGQPPPKA